MLALLGVGDLTISIWLKRPNIVGSSTTVLFWMSIMPWVVVFFLRPTIDALHKKAYNTKNVFISVLVLFISMAVFLAAKINNMLVMNVAFLLSSLTLSFLCIRTISGIIERESFRVVLNKKFLNIFTFGIAISIFYLKYKYGWFLNVRLAQMTLLFLVLSVYQTVIIYLHCKEYKLQEI